MKTGDSTTYKRQDIPTTGYEKITLGEKEDRHKGIHPTDTNTPKENMGITWSNESKRMMDKGWFIPVLLILNL